MTDAYGEDVPWWECEVSWRSLVGYILGVLHECQWEERTRPPMGNSESETPLVAVSPSPILIEDVIVLFSHRPLDNPMSSLSLDRYLVPGTTSTYYIPEFINEEEEEYIIQKVCSA